MEQLRMTRCLNCMKEYQEKEGACPYCGGVENRAPNTLKEGSIIDGRYLAGAIRCQGEKDLWYIGWDTLFHRRVLIMEYFPRELALREAGGAVKAQKSHKETFAIELDNFIKESRQLITLDDTPGLLNVLAVTEDQGTAYVIMEYPEGTILQKLLQEQDICPPEQVQWLVQELSGPIAAAHRRGVVHGQINAERIFVLPDGDCLIGGFYGSLAGKDFKTGVEADIMSLAGLAGSMLTGRVRWKEHSFEENLQYLRQFVPECVTDALRAALGEERDRRPGSMRRFADLFLDEATIEMYSE